MKKKIFYCLTALIPFLTSCKKESPVPGNDSSKTVSFNIDGSSKTFNTTVSAMNTNTQNVYELKIVAYKQQGLSTRMEITITSTNPITQGTYNDNPAAGIQVQLVYYVDDIVIVTPHYSNGTPNSGFIIVDEINGSYVKGSFFGTLYYNTYLGSYGTNILSNGVFNVSF